MNKHVLWSIWCDDALNNGPCCLIQFDEGESILEVTQTCLMLESAGVNDPSIHVEVYYTEDEK